MSHGPRVRPDSGQPVTNVTKPGSLTSAGDTRIPSHRPAGDASSVRSHVSAVAASSAIGVSCRISSCLNQTCGRGPPTDSARAPRNTAAPSEVVVSS